MTNAKDEFTKHIKNVNKDVLCAKLWTREWDWKNGSTVQPEWIPKDTLYILHLGHTQDELKFFLKKLDFSYDDIDTEGIMGHIWFKDMSWSERRVNINGCERWEYIVSPELPFDVFKKQDG